MPEGRTSDTEHGSPALAEPGPTLSSNVPQQVTYSGQHYIELRLAPTDFVATARAHTEGRP
jgi:hypothetical protein